MQLDWCLYKRSLDDTTVEIEDYEQIFIATQEGEILIEEVIDDYLRLTNEEKQAEELVKEYLDKETHFALTDAPLDEPDHPAWDRWLKLVNRQGA